MSRSGLYRRAVLIVLLTLTLGNYVAAATLNPGDLVVADPDAFGLAGGIIRVDPTTGAQTVVSSGGIFADPTGVAIAANGDIVIVDRARRVVRVDPTTGTQTIVSSGGRFVDPFRIAIDANGDFLVADVGARAIVRVDPTSGDQTIVSAGGSFISPIGLAIASMETFSSQTLTHLVGRAALSGSILRRDTKQQSPQQVALCRTWASRSLLMAPFWWRTLTRSAVGRAGLSASIRRLGARQRSPPVATSLPRWVLRSQPTVTSSLRMLLGEGPERAALSE